MLRVDVAMITYNQEDYIREAIESVLAQKTSFPVRMVIGEDCSTDRTRDILLSYQQRYPDQILLLLPQHNQGVMKNLRQVIDKCDAPYFAILEGDDYWLDPEKLQKQIDFLESNSNVSLVFHDAYFVKEGNIVDLFSNKFNHILGLNSKFIYQNDVINNGWFIPTASMVFRRSKMDIPQWFEQVYSGDYSLQLLATQQGDAYYISEIMSAYRLHSGGITKNKYTDTQMKKFVYENQCFVGIVKDEYRKDAERKFHTSIQNTYFDLSVFFANNNKFLQFYYYYKAISVSGTIFRKHIKRIIKKSFLKN